MRRLIRLLGSATLLLMFASCEDPSSTGLSVPASGDAQLTILNALIDSKPFSALMLDGAVITLPTAGGARGVAIDLGLHRLDAIDSAGRLMASAEFNVGAGGRRTAILAGISSGVLLLVASDTASLPAAGSSKIRIVHMAEGTSLLDAYLYRDTEQPDSSALVMSAFGYGQGTSRDFPGYVVRPPWAYRVRITAAGSLNPLVESPIFHTLSGEIWSVILSRSTSGVLSLQPIRER